MPGGSLLCEGKADWCGHPLPGTVSSIFFLLLCECTGNKNEVAKNQTEASPSPNVRKASVYIFTSASVQARLLASLGIGPIKYRGSWEFGEGEGARISVENRFRV